ncbi:hypothetical protein D9M72_590440 [compost metagenome]
MQCRTTGQRLHLGLTGPLQEVDFLERLGHARTTHQQTVVAQDHRPVRTEVGNQALALIQRQRDALIGVIGQLAVELQRMLTDRQ